MTVLRPTNFSPVQPLVSDTVNAAPTAAELKDQEIGINTVDEILYVKNLAGVVVPLQFGGSTVVNNTLTGTATDEALSAAQGAALKALIDGLGTVMPAADIAARDALAASGDADASDIVHVVDDGDGKWARYQNTGTAAAPVWLKISDEDALANGLVATDLAVTPSPTNLVVTNTSGNDATLPLATQTNAGVLPPSTGVVGDVLFATATGYVAATPAAAGTF